MIMEEGLKVVTITGNAQDMRAWVRDGSGKEKITNKSDSLISMTNTRHVTAWTHWSCKQRPSAVFWHQVRSKILKGEPLPPKAQISAEAGNKSHIWQSFTSILNPGPRKLNWFELVISSYFATGETLLGTISESCWSRDWLMLFSGRLRLPWWFQRQIGSWWDTTVDGMLL